MERYGEKILYLRDIAEDSKKIFKVISGHLNTPEIKEYIGREYKMAERFVYELAVKLRKIGKSFTDTNNARGYRKPISTR
ncbi:MAG: hypothetical protein QXQ57_00415 [Sulfolobales archaeon]